MSAAEISAILTGVLMVAVVVVRYTKTKKDDEIVAMLTEVMETLKQNKPK